MEHSSNVCFHHEILWAPVLSSSVFCTFECIRKRTSVVSWFSCGADRIMIDRHGRQFSSIQRELSEWNQGAETVFVLTAVSRYNLYTIKSILFKDATQWFLVNLQRYISITVQFYNISITSKRTLVPICCHSLFCFTPAPGNHYSISYHNRFAFFWTVCINGITQYMFVCSWLFSLDIVFLSFIYLGVCISTSFEQMYIILFIRSPTGGYLDYLWFGLLWIMLLWTFTCKSSCGHVFSFLMVRYLNEEWLHHIVKYV